MLPYRLQFKSSQIVEVKNFTDNNYKTVFGYTYEELCEMFDVCPSDLTEREYNEGKGFLPYGIYGNCYYRFYCAARVFTPFGMKVLHYLVVKK